MTAFQSSAGSIPRRSGLLGGTMFSGKHLRIALVAAAGFVCVVPAHAAVFWSDDDDVLPREVMTPEPPQPPRPKKPRRDPKLEKLEKAALKDNVKPVGPLVIAISIDQQRLRVYDANGLFAETPVSTGMSGHTTPMGVFSVIQKNKWHRSNIYSGAPMPYMQRITWSGIALHAGVLPGHPASHGCIRMPNAFAVKMWGWTRMGARVIITPGVVTPSDITNPALLAQKPSAPPPAAAIAVKDIVTTAKADKTTSAAQPAELGLKPTSDVERTKTADASNAMVPPARPVMSDAGSSQPVAAATTIDAAKDVSKDIARDPVKMDDGTILTRRDVDAAIAKVVELPPSKSADTAATTSATPAPSTTDSAKVDAPKVTASVADAKKDDTRPIDPSKVDTPPAPDTGPKRTGQIAVLISGKDGKLYVRQNFSPLFETPITIAPSDRPLGTHVFTARLDKSEANALHWTAVTLPAMSRGAEDNDRVSRRRRSAGAVEVKPRALPDSAAEALDRLSIPPEAMAQIGDAIATGGSIIVSDQSIRAGGETGQGTEFVVPLR